MLGFEQLVNQLQRTGHRRLVVLSGDEAWTLSRDPSARYVTGRLAVAGGKPL